VIKKIRKSPTRRAPEKPATAAKSMASTAKAGAAQARKIMPPKAPSSARPPKPPKPVKLPKSAKPAKPGKKAKAAKPASEKRVHGSFSMPRRDHALIAALKARCKREGRSVKKNQLLRAGLRALSAMASDQLAAALAELDQPVAAAGA
jgi:hypothetical protein